MEFLVEFDISVPSGASSSEVARRFRAEAAAAASLARDGHLVRLWGTPGAAGERTAIGVYRAGSETELRSLLAALPLDDWMRVTVTPLAAHPNDPVSAGQADFQLPDPGLVRVYRLEATVGVALELGAGPGAGAGNGGRRRVVPLTGGTFTGPELNGTLVPGVSADWQTVLADGTALGDIRYTLRTDAGALLSVRSRSVRHGSAEVLARLGRGEQVDPSEYTFRASTEIETDDSGLDWLNLGVFASVAGRQPAGVVYETYLVR